MKDKAQSFKMITGIIKDVVMVTYSRTDIIIFRKIMDNKKDYYMEVIMTVDDVEEQPIYFKWNNIPRHLYAIFMHSNMFSEKILDEETQYYKILGTHILRQVEKKYLMAIFKMEDYPVNKKYVSFEEYDTDAFYSYSKENYNEIAEAMVSVKKYPPSFIRGSMINRGG